MLFDLRTLYPTEEAWNQAQLRRSLPGAHLVGKTPFVKLLDGNSESEWWLAQGFRTRVFILRNRPRVAVVLLCAECEYSVMSSELLEMIRILPP